FVGGGKLEKAERTAAAVLNPDVANVAGFFDKHSNLRATPPHLLIVFRPLLRRPWTASFRTIAKPFRRGYTLFESTRGHEHEARRGPRSAGEVLSSHGGTVAEMLDAPADQSRRQIGERPRRAIHDFESVRSQRRALERREFRAGAELSQLAADGAVD